MAYYPKVIRLKHQPKNVQDALFSAYKGMKYYEFGLCTKEQLQRLGYNVSKWIDDPFKDRRK